MPLDLLGNIVSTIQIIALLFLIIGIYPVRIRVKNRNLLMHGFLSILALVLSLTTVFSVMIPILSNSLTPISKLLIVQSLVVWLHVGSGIAAISLSFVIIVSWLTHPLGELGCSKRWKLMMPTFLIWSLALILGLTVHIFNIF